MDKKKGYAISIFGEFLDKSMENEFLVHNVSSYSKAISFVALVIGIVSMFFLATDYYDLESASSFYIIAVIRLLFFTLSIIYYFTSKYIKKHTTIISLTTIYEAVITISFLIILEQYNTLRFLSVFSLMAITLAIYFIPNKILYSQIISLVLSVLFFLFPAKKITGLEEYDILKLVAYQVIMMVFCNVSACLTNSYRRRQYTDSRELWRLSVTDPLTGIYNRAMFDHELDRCVSISNRSNSPLSLIIFDIDDFKLVNDSYGHLVGDKVIKEIVSTVKKSIRNTDIFARWGGEEFVILLPDTDLIHAEEIAERIRVYVQNCFFDKAKKISCSFGIAAYEKNDTAHSLLQKADDMLMKAKAGGKDRVVSKHILMTF